MATNKGRGRFGTYVSEVTKIFNSLYAKNKKEVDDHIKEVKEKKEYKDLEIRIAWDVARAAKYHTWGFWPKTQGGYIDATDDQLTTLFKQALKKSNIKLNEKPDYTKNAYAMAVMKNTDCNFKEAKKKVAETKKKILKQKKEQDMAKQTSFNFTKRGVNSKRASQILKDNREEYQSLLKAEIRKQKGKKDVTKAAKAASKKHHKMSWKEALKKASK